MTMATITSCIFCLLVSWKVAIMCMQELVEKRERERVAILMSAAIAMARTTSTRERMRDTLILLDLEPEIVLIAMQGSTML